MPYTFIIIAVLAALLAGSGVLVKNAWETNAKLEEQIKDARAETAKANEVIGNLQITNAVNNLKLTHLEAERSEDRIRYETQISEIRSKLDSSARAALEEPERFGRIATYNNRRLMREVCRSSGGSEAACRIAIPEPSDPKTEILPAPAGN